ncbi:MAG: hypothetical protein GTO02_09500 [Candidatus Dadabacteria bacterium]|nr:hypothetical protein [Candidatus Dadabacteria bacterium]NIQ14616.1 hypothetical protein [Candidatus Dadabacteria bacterium]
MNLLKKLSAIFLMFVLTFFIYACPPQSDKSIEGSKDSKSQSNEIVEGIGDSLERAAEMIEDATKDAAEVANNASDLVKDATTDAIDSVRDVVEETPQEKNKKEENKQ